MAFGIYIHIPYCLQRCNYCDFATYEQSTILPPSEYIEFVKKEISVYGPHLRNRTIDTIYFGGGTPSLVPAELLLELLETLKLNNFQLSEDAEITIEINPATINEKKLDLYCGHGFNRFSVGAQTFNDSLLKRVGREHDAADTRATLELLASRNLNYTFDLLFALPGQTLDILREDLRWVKQFNPYHLSAYCLTVPEGHPLAKVRLPEQEQIEMFEIVERHLLDQGLERYEISNFARPGYESRHNLIYWTDQEYWGIGLGAHSYIKEGEWGQRFWNSNNIKQYTSAMANLPEQVDGMLDHRSRDSFEELKENQALTDYCHVFLRLKKGLSLAELENKFGATRRRELNDIFLMLKERGLLEPEGHRWRLSPEGIMVSNRVFEFCTFLE